jgi:hypothetical protein
VIDYALANHWLLTHKDEAQIITVGMTEEAEDAIDDYHDLGNTTLSDAKRSLLRIAETGNADSANLPSRQGVRKHDRPRFGRDEH